MFSLNKIKNNLLIYIFLFFLFYHLIIKLLNIFILISGYDCNLVLNAISIPSGESNSSEPVDPVRWWPSGVPQGIATIASSIGVYGALTKLNATPRLRVIGALVSAGVTSSHIIYNSALSQENSVGFNRFMVGITQYKETGKWPSISDMSNNSSDEVVKDFINKNVTSTIETEAMKKAKEIIAMDSNSTGGTNNFLPSDETNIMESIQDYFFKCIFELFKPVPSAGEGYLDDLLVALRAKRLFIESILFFLCICIFILFIIFIINLYLYINKESILSINTSNIRIINLYLNYQIIIIKFSLIIFPFFIIFGLYTLCHSFID